MAIDNQISQVINLPLCYSIFTRIYSHLLAFTRIYSHSKLIIIARTKFPRGFLHIELKVILDLDTIVCLIRTLLYGESEIHAIQCQDCTKNLEVDLGQVQ